MAIAISKFRLTQTLTLISNPLRKTSSPQRLYQHPMFSPIPASASASLSVAAFSEPITVQEDELTGFITGRRRATEIAHSAWKRIVRRGDVVVDATCGNGHDTLALLKMIADESGSGCVYGMDIQTSALEYTSSLLEQSVDNYEKKLVKLYLRCHSKMEDIVPKDTPVRLITFNLGYLPGGDKAVVTSSQTTLMALQASSRLLMPGGLISMVVYVGHPGGRNELETVQSFAASLPADSWVCTRSEILNRPTAPVLILLYKK